MRKSEIIFPIELIAFDFDGVFTNNQALVLEDGTEGVFINRSDGLAVNILRENDFKMIIISTEKNRVVEARAQKLKIPVISGVDDKKDVLLKYCKNEQINFENTIFIGNDINDRKVMEIVGLAICPNDAHPSIREISKLILKTNVGNGVIRELMDILLSENK